MSHFNKYYDHIECSVLVLLIVRFLIDIHVLLLPILVVSVRIRFSVMKVTVIQHAPRRYRHQQRNVVQVIVVTTVSVFTLASTLTIVSVCVTLLMSLATPSVNVQLASHHRLVKSQQLNNSGRLITGLP